MSSLKSKAIIQSLLRSNLNLYRKYSVMPVNIFISNHGTKAGLFQNCNFYTPTAISHIGIFRNFSMDESSNNHDGNIILMDFPLIQWPKLTYSIRNFIFEKFLIPRFDSEFTLAAFKETTKKVLVIVSDFLSKGNFDSLDGLIDPKAMEEIKKNFKSLSLKQREHLSVKIEDIVYAFPYQVGLIFREIDGQKDRVFLEITMCYHIYRGVEDQLQTDIQFIMKNRSDNKFDALNQKGIPDKITIANYRFIREITKGVVDDWTINILNHYKPMKIS